MKTVSVQVCVGTSCHLMGAEDIINAIEGLPDNIRKWVDLSLVNCLDSCDRAPRVQVNGRALTRTNARQVISVIKEELQGGSEPNEQTYQ